MMIYLDHHSTTPLDPDVRMEMESVWSGQPGNPMSLHSGGEAARRVLDMARRRVADLLNADPGEILFTGSGTESDNLAVLGAWEALGRKSAVVTSRVEHQAVLGCVRYIGECGGNVRWLPVDSSGVVQVSSLPDDSGRPPDLVSVMLANNEVGTVQPIREIRDFAPSAVLHCDAVAAAGKMPVDVRRLGVDLLSVSAHKFGGPQGVGALFVRNGLRLCPRLFGGHQERGLRPGTHSLAAIAGMGKACELSRQRMDANAQHMLDLKNSFEKAVMQLPGVIIHAAGVPRVCSLSSVCFEGVSGDDLLMHLDLHGIHVSTRSACSSGDKPVSHVLAAMGLDESRADSTVRFAFGSTNTADEVNRVLAILGELVPLLRGGVS